MGMMEKIQMPEEPENICPKTIEVCDDRTYALLSDWCQEMNIKLEMLDDQPEELAELEQMMLIQAQPERGIEAMEQMDDDDEDWDDDDDDWDEDE